MSRGNAEVLGVEADVAGGGEHAVGVASSGRGARFLSGGSVGAVSLRGRGVLVEGGAVRVQRVRSVGGGGVGRSCARVRVRRRRWVMGLFFDVVVPIMAFLGLVLNLWVFLRTRGGARIAGERVDCVA